VSGRLPIVAVVGRPNVGKSTFFNRVLGRRLAIVDDQPGVTRDRNFAVADWAGRHFFIVDTGGVVEGSDEPMDRAVRAQALAAVDEADLILFLVDGIAGIHPLDQGLAEMLRKSGRPVLLVVNKVDNLPRDAAHHEFWALGLGEPLPVSATSGKGSGNLLDRVVARLPESPVEPEGPGVVRVAVIGKPNVGKSSFINRLLGEDRVVVDERSGTTRDPVDTPMRHHGRTVVFVDTAGLRRQSRVKDSIEYYSSLRTSRVVEDADVCLAMIDGTEPLHIQDLRVIEQAWEAGAGVVLLVNKWDLVEKDTHTAPAFEREMRERAPFLKWVPIRFVSALTGQRVHQTLDLVLEVAAERERRIETHDVNQALIEIVSRQPPPHHRGRPVRLRYGTQVATAPPTFVLFANFPKAVPAHYIRYLHNAFRERWGFVGSPVRIFLRESKKKDTR
jgi:GTP-binding protein